MKKSVIVVLLLSSVTLLLAGGKIMHPTPTEVVEIPLKPCKADKVFVDYKAKLMWQDQLFTDGEDRSYKQEGSLGKAGRWSHADYYCRTLIYRGYSDWRLPTSDELQEVHRLEGQVFTYFRERDFWTSTPAAKGKYFVVYPADAYRYEHKTHRSNYIRCVRCLHKGDTVSGPKKEKNFLGL